MNKLDVISLFTIGIYLMLRQWPYGDSLQTVTDIAFGISVLLIVSKHYLKRKK